MRLRSAGGWRADRRRVGGRIVADVAVRHPQDALRVIRLGPGRDLPAVGQQVVHGLQPRGAHVAGPGDLDRGRLAGEDQEAIFPGVARQVEKDIDAAKQCILIDREVDDLNMQVNRELFTIMMEKPSTMTQAFGLIMVAKALERVGDHATNIAERAVYFIEGLDIRHQE